jgi:hypothetical protein
VTDQADVPVAYDREGVDERQGSRTSELVGEGGGLGGSLTCLVSVEDDTASASHLYRIAVHCVNGVDIPMNCDDTTRWGFSRRILGNVKKTGLYQPGLVDKPDRLNTDMATCRLSSVRHESADKDHNNCE